MKLRSIAWRIARTKISDEHTSYNPGLVPFITEEMRASLDIDPSSKPYEEGIRSVVFDNRKGNIVVFTEDREVRRIARSIEGKFEEILPKIYKTETFSEDDSKDFQIIAVEMEKLKPLNGDEEIIFTAWQDDFDFGFTDPEELEIIETDVKTKVETGHYTDFLLSEQGRKMEDLDFTHFSKVQSHMIEAMADLAKRSYNLDVYHDDLHAQNVAWGKNGQLKFIDLESIRLNHFDLAPQSVR